MPLVLGNHITVGGHQKKELAQQATENFSFVWFSSDWISGSNRREKLFFWSAVHHTAGGPARNPISIHSFASSPPEPGQAALPWSSVFIPSTTRSLLPNWGPSSSPTCPVWLHTLFSLVRWSWLALSWVSSVISHFFSRGEANPTTAHGLHLPCIWPLKGLVNIGDSISNWSLAGSYNTISIQTKMYLTRKELTKPL